MLTYSVTRGSGPGTCGNERRPRKAPDCSGRFRPLRSSLPSAGAEAPAGRGRRSAVGRVEARRPATASGASARRRRPSPPPGRPRARPRSRAGPPRSPARRPAARRPGPSARRRAARRSRCARCGAARARARTTPPSTASTIRPGREPVRSTRHATRQYTQTVMPIGRMLFAQIQFIAAFETRVHPCDAGYGGTDV